MVSAIEFINKVVKEHSRHARFIEKREDYIVLENSVKVPKFRVELIPAVIKIPPSNIMAYIKCEEDAPGKVMDKYPPGIIEYGGIPSLRVEFDLQKELLVSVEFYGVAKYVRYFRREYEPLKNLEKGPLDKGIERLAEEIILKKGLASEELAHLNRYR